MFLIFWKNMQRDDEVMLVDHDFFAFLTGGVLYAMPRVGPLLLLVIMPLGVFDVTSSYITTLVVTFAWVWVVKNRKLDQLAFEALQKP